MASRSRLGLIFCAGLLKAACRQGSLTWSVLLGRTEHDWNLGDNSLESYPYQCYQRDRQLSRI